MTTTPDNSGTADFEGKAVPPYEGRRESADVDDEEKRRRDGANVGGATGPVERDRREGPRRPGRGRRAEGPPPRRPPAGGGRLTGGRAAGLRYARERPRPGVGRAGAP